jgi:metal-responsive CopG/Arc/MetJ family transcriptional regulator
MSIDKNMIKSNTIGMKTAISIPDDLFKEVDRLAEEKKTSRSRIFCSAVTLYLEKIKSQRLLEELNSAYGPEESSEERLVRKKSTEYYKNQIIKKEE